VANFGDEVGKAGLDFGASERLGTLAAHGVAARSSLEFCFVNVQRDRIAHRLTGKRQGAARKLFRPGFCGFRIFGVHSAHAPFGILSRRAYRLTAKSADSGLPSRKIRYRLKPLQAQGKPAPHQNKSRFLAALGMTTKSSGPPKSGAPWATKPSHPRKARVGHPKNRSRPRLFRAARSRACAAATGKTNCRSLGSSARLKPDGGAS